MFLDFSNTAEDPTQCRVCLSARDVGCVQAAEEATAASDLLARAEAAFEELRLAEAVAAQQGESCFQPYALLHGRHDVVHRSTLDMRRPLVTRSMFSAQALTKRCRS